MALFPFSVFPVPYQGVGGLKRGSKTLYSAGGSEKGEQGNRLIKVRKTTKREQVQLRRCLLFWHCRLFLTAQVSR